MAKSSPPPFERAFTLIEVLVVIAIIVILAAILIPSLNSALESAKATKDLSNLRQIGALMQTYLNDKDRFFPLQRTWPGTKRCTPVLYPKYVGTRRIFQSPFDKRPSLETDLAPVSYSINHNMYAVAAVNGNMLKVASPASTFFMAPTYTGNPAALSWTGTAYQRTRFASRRYWGNNGNSSQWQEDQRPILRLAHRNRDIRPGKHRRDISRYNASARLETLGPNEVTSALA